MQEIIDAAYAALDMARGAARHGVVNARGYDRSGNPIGGHLTSAAMGDIAVARHMLAALGVPWEETTVVLPD